MGFDDAGDARCKLACLEWGIVGHSEIRNHPSTRVESRALHRQVHQPVSLTSVPDLLTTLYQLLPNPPNTEHAILPELGWKVK